MTQDEETRESQAATMGPEVEQPRRQGRFEEVETDFFRFKHDGASIEGRLSDVKPMQIAGTPGYRYTVVDDSGHARNFHGASDLDDKMGRVEIDMYIRVTRVGLTEERSASGYPVMRYKVEIQG